MRRRALFPGDLRTHATHRPDRGHQSQAKRGKRALAIERLEARVLLTYPTAVVTSIDRSAPTGQYTSDTSVAYAVTFNTPVTGVDPTDFGVITDGSFHAQTLVSVMVSG